MRRAEDIDDVPELDAIPVDPVEPWTETGPVAVALGTADA